MGKAVPLLLPPNDFVGCREFACLHGGSDPKPGGQYVLCWRGLGAYLLNAFTLTANGVALFSTSQPVTLTPLNPGNGFSDATISGFDLTSLPANTQIQFTTNFSGGTAGREQYFLRGDTPTTQAVSATPEPGTWLLVGTGMFALIRRKLRQQ